MPQRLLLVLLVAAVATLNVAALDQTPPPPLTFELAMMTTWKTLHNRILEMAKDTVFPEDKLGWKPHPDARSVLDEFRQVTLSLQFSTAQLRGEKLDRVGVGARRKADEDKPKARASVVRDMEAAIAISYPLVEKSPTPLLIGWIRDQPSITASSSPTTARWASSRRSAASPRRSREVPNGSCAG
jgi:hypothetical protein